MPSSSLILSVGAILSTLSPTVFAAKYSKFETITGANWLDSFKFKTYDYNNGFVNYVDEATAKRTGLYKTDNDDVVFGVDAVEKLDYTKGPGRKSVRLEGNQNYNKGLFVLDVKAMPGVCGMWPAFWSLGQEPWPVKGEIDIIEGVNDNKVNKYVLHTDTKCKVDGKGMTAAPASMDCALDGSNGSSGCDVNEVRTSSFGAGFNGGYYVLEWDSDVIQIWFFPRGSTVPHSLTSDNPDTSEFGVPAAKFAGSGCDIEQRFKDQRFIFTNNFCGDWAGNVYSQSGCPKQYGPDGKTELNSMDSCKKFVADNPHAFEGQFWRIGSFKTYKKDSVVSSSSIFMSRTSSMASSSSMVSSSASSSRASSSASSTMMSSSSSMAVSSSASSRPASSSSSAVISSSVSSAIVSSSFSSAIVSSSASSRAASSSSSVGISSGASTAVMSSGPSSRATSSSSSAISSSVVSSSASRPVSSSSSAIISSSASSRPASSSSSAVSSSVVASSASRAVSNSSSVMMSSSASPRPASNSSTSCSSSAAVATSMSAFRNSTSASSVRVSSSSSRASASSQSLSFISSRVVIIPTGASSSSLSSIRPLGNSSVPISYTVPAYGAPSSVPGNAKSTPCTTSSAKGPSSTPIRQSLPISAMASRPISSQPPVSKTTATTTYTTTYIDVCETGYITKTTTFTVTYYPTTTPTPGKPNPPPTYGWDVTTKVCQSGCGNGPTKVTVTIPCTKCDLTKATPTPGKPYTPSTSSVPGKPTCPGPNCKDTSVTTTAKITETKIITLTKSPVPDTPKSSAGVVSSSNAPKVTPALSVSGRPNASSMPVVSGRPSTSVVSDRPNTSSAGGRNGTISISVGPVATPSKTAYNPPVFKGSAESVRVGSTIAASVVVAVLYLLGEVM